MHEGLLGQTMPIRERGITSFAAPEMRFSLTLRVLPLLCIGVVGQAQDVAATNPTTAEIHGRVADSRNQPLGDVTVMLIGIAQVETDTAGQFRFLSLPPGTYFLRAIRIGARPALERISVNAGDRARVDLSLSSDAQQLTAIQVRAESSLTPISDPTGFLRRKRTGQGVYLTGDEIDRRQVARTEFLFAGIPDVRVDTGGIVLIARGTISFKDMLGGSRIWDRDNAQLRDCIGVQVLVDGVLMPQPFDVNRIPPRSIGAIELYRGPATTPPELRSPKTVCGTLAIWSR